ncbi:DNA-binding transcriptional MocR family regulator [Kineosphaera limosa]|uniref:Putative aminotransferase n=1 Tax=Kineosphaera limosa NBRC 100340 TaxID=1184609 RepID=K6XHF1_9MICO|nr:PLP-dependent aminotransferase family protein [Kineosphaera limosa]NYE00422.1 DNA-binding transcriptional MocR family regulator [Kineosphaera limosa]GAB98264.1 putative aminotransferase [Kineosphaera limosa NBRC 100340]
MRFAARMSGVQPSAIRELLRLGDDPTITSFGGGYPDPATFPVTPLAAAYEEVLATSGRTALQYTATVGLPRLREQVAARLSADGSPTGADDILILQGAQQGLDFVAKLLIDPGDLIITANPTFLGALIAFNPYQPTYLGIDGDEHGLDTEALEAVLLGGTHPRFVYVVPDFANPTGTTMSLPRRQHLLALAQEFDFLVLEDTPYRALRFEGRDVPTLRSLDTAGRVIHLGSFSKILAPGLRLGWAAASPELLEPLGLLKLAADTQTATLSMSVTAHLLQEFDLEAHIETIRHGYGRKRDLMVKTMRDAFPTSVQVSEPEGGLFTWVTFPRGFDAADFMARVALPQAKVAYVPGATFFPVHQEANHARFSYSGVADEQMVDAVTRLGELLRAELGG